jgi:hypothetical protein
MTPPSLKCVLVHNSVENHPGCKYVSHLFAGGVVPQTAGEPLPGPPCGTGRGDGAFVVVPLPNGDGLKVPVCEHHGRVVVGLCGGAGEGEGA